MGDISFGNLCCLRFFSSKQTFHLFVWRKTWCLWLSIELLLVLSSLTKLLVTFWHIILVKWDYRLSSNSRFSEVLAFRRLTSSTKTLWATSRTNTGTSHSMPSCVSRGQPALIHEGHPLFDFLCSLCWTRILLTIPVLCLLLRSLQFFVSTRKQLYPFIYSYISVAPNRMNVIL